MERLNRFIGKHGMAALLRLPLYPFISLFWGPVRLFSTVWNSRILLTGKWSEFLMYRPYQGISFLFYWTQALNLKRFGRNGISPLVGLGNFNLSAWWHLSLPSSYLFRKAGAVLAPASMFSWLAMHGLWISNPLTNAPLLWWFLVMVLILISSTFFAGAFVFLNYNALGWLFFPLGLWGMETGNYLVAGLAWLGASFGSFTVVFIASYLSLVSAIRLETFLPLLALVPALLKLSTHFFHLTKGSFFSSLLKIAKLIGLVNQNAKYRRSKIGNSIGFFYFLFLYFQFSVVYFWVTQEIHWLFCGGIVLYLVNRFVARFADDQSLYLTMFSLACMITLQTSDLLLLTSFWLVVSPLPALLGDVTQGCPLDAPPALKPFRVQAIIDNMSRFLKPVRSKDRVLMAFSDPKGSYEKLFDGYRRLLEVPCYIGSSRGFHFFPDWHAVSETNYEGAPDLWGRAPSEVSANLKRWEASYAIVYQDSGTELDTQWERNGYKTIAELDWEDCRDDLMGGIPCEMGKPVPKWWLLKNG
jgi:hypothetical protein